MPIYLCQPGSASKEPWRHGVQVYSRPFPLDGYDSPSSSSRRGVPVEGGPARDRAPEQVVVMLGDDAGAGADGAGEEEALEALERYLTEFLPQEEGGMGGGGGADRALVFCARGADGVAARVGPGRGGARGVSTAARGAVGGWVRGEFRVLVVEGGAGEFLFLSVVRPTP